MSLCSLSDSDEILPASKKRPRPATLAEEASPRPPPLRKGPPPSFPPSDGILALTDSSSDDESVVKKDAFTLAESSSDEEPPVEVQQGAPPSPVPGGLLQVQQAQALQGLLQGRLLPLPQCQHPMRPGLWLR